MEVQIIRKLQPSYMRSLSYFTALLETLYFNYFKVHVADFLQHVKLERPLNC